MSFALLKSAQEILIESSYQTPARTRLSGMARTVETWLFQGASTEDVETMVNAIVTEKDRIAETINRATARRMPQSARVQELFLEGVLLHHQACEALIQSMDDGDVKLCQSVQRLLEQGDRRIEEAEELLILCKVKYGYVGAVAEAA